MRAKTVNEKVNFERGQDPKDSMGIGIFKFFPKRIFEEDSKYNMQSMKTSGLQSFNHSGAIIGIYIEANKLILKFYLSDYYMNGIPLDKIKYCDMILKNTGWRDVFANPEIQHSDTLVKYDINPKYRDKFPAQSFYLRENYTD